MSDPLNLLIERVPQAGYIEGHQVFLHNGLRVPVAGSGAYYGPSASSWCSTAEPLLAVNTKAERKGRGQFVVGLGTGLHFEHHHR